MNDRISWIRAFYWIVMSTVLISGTSYLGYFQYRRWIKHRQTDKNFTIQYLLQKPLSANTLTTEQLAELLHLSYDRPANLFLFDEKQAENSLQHCPLIEKAQVIKIKPNALKVTYKMREPMAILLDYENTAVDSKGYLFPLSPYYLEQNILKLRLGLQEQEITMQRPISHPVFELAVNIIALLKNYVRQDQLLLQQIDLSRAFCESMGKREIIICLEDRFMISQYHFSFPKILRLHTTEYAKQISNFFELNKKMQQDYQKQICQIPVNQDKKFSIQVIDMRIPQLAFIEEN